MATFSFGRAIDIHWQGYEIVGPAGTVFSIPDQLYEEFNDDIAPVEPTLVWIDENEFLTLSNSVSVTTLTGTIPISVTSTTSGKVVSISSSTNPAGYYLRADGTGATTWAALPADATGITNIIGTSPISAAVVGTTATISLDANYQTAGNYQIAGNYQTAGTYVNAVIGTSPASVLTASGTSTVSIVAASINSTHLSATSVGSSQLIAQAVGTAAISSGAATSGQLLQSDGLGAAVFATVSAAATVSISEFTATGTWTKPAGAKAVYVMLLGAGGSGRNGKRESTALGEAQAQDSGYGGGKVEAVFDASVLDATVTVTIGAGGASIAGSTGTTATNSTVGVSGGLTYFGTSSLYYLFVGGGFGGAASTNAVARNSVVRWNATKVNPNSLIFDLETGAPGKDMNSMGATGGISENVTSTAISLSDLTQTDRLGYAGFGITAGVTRTTTASTAGANGQSATSGFGTSGSAGMQNNTASGLNAGNGGNGGNGFRGGGGGAGGSVWAASGTSRTTGSGGAGGDGYAVVISW